MVVDPVAETGRRGEINTLHAREVERTAVREDDAIPGDEDPLLAEGDPAVVLTDQPAPLRNQKEAAGPAVVDVAADERGRLPRQIGVDACGEDGRYQGSRRDPERRPGGVQSTSNRLGRCGSRRLYLRLDRALQLGAQGGEVGWCSQNAVGWFRVETIRASRCRARTGGAKRCRHEVGVESALELRATGRCPSPARRRLLAAVGRHRPRGEGLIPLGEQLLEARRQLGRRLELPAPLDCRLLRGQLRLSLGRSLDAFGEVVHLWRNGRDAVVLIGSTRFRADEIADEPEHRDREDRRDPDDRGAELLDPRLRRQLERGVFRLCRWGPRLHQRAPPERTKARLLILTDLRERPTPVTNSPRSKRPSTMIHDPFIR